MVTFINVQAAEQGFVKRFKRRLRKKRPEIRQVPVEGGLPFFVIDAVTHKGDLPWGEIEALVRANHLRLVLPERVTPPAGIALPLFKPVEFQHIVGFRTFLYLLERFRLPAKKRAVCIIDLRGNLVNELLPLLDLAGEIMIITGRQYLYENFCDWAMRERGATVEVSDDIQRAEKFKTIFLSGALPFELGGSGGVFSCSQSLLVSRKVIAGRGITLPQECLALMPDGCDPYIFAAALYEQCNLKSLGKLTFEKFIYKDDEISLYEALSVLGGT